ncbi:hypothetical protein BU17DRAFT_67532 [Hysterangium stoloniferum]|nr:hypothetical protein BU17DRAFT_67532 [Hysterangium stoloniferum]
MTLHRHWIAFRNQKTGLSPSILVRTLIVLTISVIALFTSLTFLANLTSAVPNFILACNDIVLTRHPLVPLSAFLVFGTQHDFLQVWLFCRRERSSIRDVEKKSLPLRPGSASSVVGEV